MGGNIENYTLLFIILKGFIIGICIVAPIGPIGFLCVQRILAKGKIAGLVTGLGVATADGIYGSIAGFGLTTISFFLINQQNYIKIIGGAFLIFLGVKTFFLKTHEKELHTDKKENLLSYYFGTLFLTLTNPMTIIAFTGVFAGLGIVAENGNYLLYGIYV